MAFLNFKTFVLKYRYSNNFKTIFLTVYSPAYNQILQVKETYKIDLKFKEILKISCLKCKNMAGDYKNELIFIHQEIWLLKLAIL